MSEPSISDLLALAGYSHEHIENSASGKHLIRDKSGAVIGAMNAREACEFLERLNQSLEAAE